MKTLVIELWAMGDAIMMTGALRSLVRSGRSCSVLAKPLTCELLQPYYQDVSFIPFDAPWTVFEGKYRIWNWPWKSIYQLIRLLRRENFHEVMSVRPDPRDHFLMRLMRTPRRLGFPRSGSGVFLSECLSYDRGLHRVEHWHRLIEKLVGQVLPMEIPSIKRNQTPSAENPVCVLHVGAGQPVRRWPIAYFEAVIEALRELTRAKMIILLDADGYGNEIAQGVDQKLIPGNLESLLDCLSRAALFIGNDSGPGHLASALGVPVVTLNGPGHSGAIRPWGDKNLVLELECPHRPCFDKCHYPEPYCLTRLTPESVIPRIRKHIDNMIQKKQISGTFLK